MASCDDKAVAAPAECASLLGNGDGAIRKLAVQVQERKTSLVSELLQSMPRDAYALALGLAGAALLAHHLVGRPFAIALAATATAIVFLALLQCTFDIRRTARALKENPFQFAPLTMAIMLLPATQLFYFQSPHTATLNAMTATVSLSRRVVVCIAAVAHLALLGGAVLQSWGRSALAEAEAAQTDWLSPSVFPITVGIAVCVSPAIAIGLPPTVAMAAFILGLLGWLITFPLSLYTTLSQPAKFSTTYQAAVLAAPGGLLLQGAVILKLPSSMLLASAVACVIGLLGAAVGLVQRRGALVGAPLPGMASLTFPIVASARGFDLFLHSSYVHSWPQHGLIPTLVETTSVVLTVSAACVVCSATLVFLGLGVAATIVTARGKTSANAGTARHCADV